MKVKDFKKYEEYKNNNTDGYSLCIFRYTERWANMMEKEIKNGAKVKDIAKKLSHDADTEGITGDMYEVSVSILSQYWEYGEDLREWHNKKYDYKGYDVVSSTILTVSKK